MNEGSSHNIIQNNNTTNTNGLYAAPSNDYYIDNQQASQSLNNLPCSTSENLNNNQRQEHVLTLASEYLITSNSVIGPTGFFNAGPSGGNQYCSNEYLDRL